VAPLRSRPWLLSSPAWSTACFATGSNTWTKERRSTKRNTANYRSSSSSGRPPSLDSVLLKLTPPETSEFLGRLRPGASQRIGQFLHQDRPAPNFGKSSGKTTSLRASRRAGELIAEGQKRGEIVRQGGDRKSKSSPRGTLFYCVGKFENL